MKFADSKSLTAVTASLVALFAIGATGCSDRTEQAANNAAQSAAQDAQNHVEAADQKIENAGKEVAEETREAGEAIGGAAKQAGAEIKEETREAGEAIGGVAQDVKQGATDLGQSATLTPSIKNALVSSDNIDATNINVETDGEKNMVMLTGSVKSAKEKQLAEQVARKQLQQAKSTFKLQNNLTVGGANASASR